MIESHFDGSSKGTFLIYVPGRKKKKIKHLCRRVGLQGKPGVGCDPKHGVDSGDQLERTASSWFGGQAFASVV